MPFFTWFLLISVLLLGRFDRNPITGIGVLLTHVDGGLWFLWTVFVLAIVATFCNLAVSKGKTIGRQIAGVLIACAVFFGALLGLGMMFGLNFLGIKYILYYAVFYGFGWLARATEGIWRQWMKGKNVLLFICLVIFLAIVYNFDLYHTGDDVKSILLRCIAGFTGNAVILATCEWYKDALERIKLDWLGMYTLETYTTHMYVNNLFQESNGNIFFTASGFGNFIVSLICTVVFTAVIIAVFKSIPAANYLMYGKREKK